MNVLDKSIHKLNNYQQKTHFTAFIIAVVKKYSDDGAGRRAALLTYYSFLALFPLLLILTTITDVLIGNNPALKNTIIKGLTDYFPLLGDQLSDQVHKLGASGPVLLIALLFTLYGTRGVASAFIRGVQDVWHVPKEKRDHFPKSLYKSLALVIVGGLGFLAASIIAGVSALASNGTVHRIIYLAINLFILFWVFVFLLKMSLPGKLKIKEVKLGAVAAAISLVIVQAIGGVILAHQLKHLSALYSYFSVALGLMFWLYLQAQVLFYAMEIATVSSFRLWPRNLVGNHPTAADIRINQLN